MNTGRGVDVLTIENNDFRTVRGGRNALNFHRIQYILLGKDNDERKEEWRQSANHFKGRARDAQASTLGVPSFPSSVKVGRIVLIFSQVDADRSWPKKFSIRALLSLVLIEVRVILN